MKRIFKLIAALTALIMLAGLCACKKTEFVKEDDAEVYGGLFDNSKVHRVEIEIAEEDLNSLYASPMDKTKYSVAVTIDGNRLENVSFSTKGNTSLSSVASSNSVRYSFKLNFGKYEKGQTYFGLDKLNLNNVFADATYMKDYMSYSIMRAAGVEAPLISYAELVINGESHGLYAAIENISESFQKRTSGSEEGALFKPETDKLDNIGEGGVQQPPEMPDGTPDPNMPMPSGMPETPNGTPDPNMPMPSGMPEGGFPGGQGFPGGEGGQGFPGGQGGQGFPGGEGGQGFPGGQGGQGFPGGEGGQGFPGGQGGFPGGQGGPGGPGSDSNSGGADLKYIDDETSSYPSIFDNEENDVTDAERTRVIAALKALSTGKDVEKYWDIESIAAYFAAHDLVQNYDSYMGTMLHNYYLYLHDGKLTVLPWDYNLAFGGFMGGDAESTVNHPIDSPLSGAAQGARPLWKLFAENEEYLKLYHEKYDALLKTYFESGECEREIERVREMIAPYVEADSTAFYTADEFETAVDTLKLFIEKRVESVRKQLSGELGSSSGTQNRADMVSAEGIDISSMGSFGGGGFPGGKGKKD